MILVCVFVFFFFDIVFVSVCFVSFHLVKMCFDNVVFGLIFFIFAMVLLLVRVCVVCLCWR